jgi:hypothetical protein
MSRAKHAGRPRGALTVTFLWLLALVVLALAAALFVIGLLGIALLLEGLISWLHPVDAASAWARTLAGVGLIGGSAGVGALGWLGLERMARLRDGVARLPLRVLDPASDADTSMRRARKFVAVVGILLALICLPFAAGIHAAAHGPWLG